MLDEACIGQSQEVVDARQRRPQLTRPDRRPQPVDTCYRGDAMQQVAFAPGARHALDRRTGIEFAHHRCARLIHDVAHHEHAFAYIGTAHAFHRYSDQPAHVGGDAVAGRRLVDAEHSDTGRRQHQPLGQERPHRIRVDAEAGPDHIDGKLLKRWLDIGSRAADREWPFHTPEGPAHFIAQHRLPPAESDRPETAAVIHAQRPTRIRHVIDLTNSRQIVRPDQSASAAGKNHSTKVHFSIAPSRTSTSCGIP